MYLISFTILLKNVSLSDIADFFIKICRYPFHFSNKLSEIICESCKLFVDLMKPFMIWLTKCNREYNWFRSTYNLTPMPKCELQNCKVLCNFIEVTLRHGWPLVNLLHIFRTPFPKKTSGRLLLLISASKFIVDIHLLCEDKQILHFSCNVLVLLLLYVLLCIE